MMMRGDRALTGHAAGGYIGRPCRARERRVEQYNHEQTDARGNRTTKILTRYLHVIRVLISIVRDYSVARHSLQAVAKLAAPVPIHYTPMPWFFRRQPADLAAAHGNFCGRPHLDLECGASQTRFMSHSYIRFDFGTDEEKAQQARHKLDGWRQAFRLDKKLQYKVDRPETAVAAPAPKTEPAATAAPPEKSKGKAAEKSKGKAASAKSTPSPAEKSSPAANGKVSMLVRLYFSSHEKLSEQRWLDRIPSEEPFKSASPKVVHHSDPEFESTDKQFEALE
jgi:hypothetical protein